MKLVTNRDRPKHNDVIRDLLKRAKKVWIFVAYLGNTGTGEMEKTLKAACARGVDLELYCGLSQCITHPDALSRLFKMFRKTKAAKLYLWDRRQQTFHPKVYCFFSASELTLVIGSANLTHGGMENNIEISAVETVLLNSETATAIEAFRSDIADHVDLANELGISQYRRRYEIYKKKRKEAEKKAEKEIREVPELKLEIIKSYLSRYQKDGKDQDFGKRQSHYRDARKVLDQLVDAKHLDKSVFIQLYSELVGGGEGHRLWTSSGLARSKSEVVRHYAKVVSLIRMIRSNSGKPPESVFRIGKSQIEHIPGFGVNLLTEVMHTFGPDRFAVLNKNPLATLKKFGCDPFPSSNSFTPEMYAQFNGIVAEVKTECGFQSISQADHFLSYVYWAEKNKGKKRENVASNTS